MRKGPKFKVNKELEPNADVCIDYKSDPHATLEQVNYLLKKHGLEFVSHETDGDYFAFSLKPRRQRGEGELIRRF